MSVSAERLLERVRGECLEMPGLHVRLAQVQRLCGLGRTACLPGMKRDACYPLLKKRLD
jgi:hypothetical protein